MLDVVRRPLGSVHAAAIVVQRLAVVVWDILLLKPGTTSAVEVLAPVAVGCFEFCSLIASCNGASLGRVHGDSVFCAVVDAFDDV